MKKYISILNENEIIDKVNILFDNLKINENILLIFNRVVDLNLIEKFKYEDCRIIKDYNRNDVYWVFFPKVESNLLIFNLIKPYLEFPTEVKYICIATNLDTFLFNRNIVEKNKSIQKKLSIIEMEITHEGLKIEIESNYYNRFAFDIYNKWEKLLK